MSWDTARALLDAKLKTLSGLDPALVAWPNRKFVQPTTLYYKVDFLPSKVEPELAGANHESGIYQVSIWIPSQGGIGPALQAADAVCSLFSRQTLGTTTKVRCGVPVPAPYISAPDWLHFPVSIPFQVL